MIYVNFRMTDFPLKIPMNLPAQTNIPYIYIYKLMDI